MGTRTLNRRRIDSPHRHPLLDRFGLAARRMREHRGLTREDVGAAAGLSPVYLGCIERGEVNPTLLTQERLAIGLGVRLDELLAAALCDELVDQR